MQKERGSSRSLSLHEEIEREAREIEEEMKRHPELDNIRVTEEMDAALFKKIQAYEEELEEEREAVKKVEENLRRNHYLPAAYGEDERAGGHADAGIAARRAGENAGAGDAARRFRIPGDSVEFSAELMPEIPRGFGLGGRDADVGVAVETVADQGNVAESAAVDAGEGKVLYRRKKRKYLLVSLAAVLVIVLGVGGTSVGSKSHWKVLWERITGGEPMNVINTEDMDSYESGDGIELTAYQEIRDKLNIKPVRIRYTPAGMKLDDYQIQKEMLKAELLYKYKGEVIRYFLYMNDEDSSLVENKEDKEIDKYTVLTKEIEIKVEEFKVLDNIENRQVAKFEYKGMHYVLMGIMERAEFEKILENLYFY